MQTQEPTGIADCFTFCFRKSNLEEKLTTYGIRVHIKSAKLRRVQNVSNQSDLLVPAELVLLSNNKLEELKKALENEVSKVNVEMMQLLEEQQVTSSENGSLADSSKELEEQVKKMTRPWVNRYPNSAALTRVLLLS